MTTRCSQDATFADSFSVSSKLIKLNVMIIIILILSQSVGAKKLFRKES